MEAQPEVRYVQTTLYSVKVTRYFQGCVSRASNVGYFFLVEAQPEVRYVHTTL